MNHLVHGLIGAGIAVSTVLVIGLLAALSMWLDDFFGDGVGPIVLATVALVMAGFVVGVMM